MQDFKYAAKLQQFATDVEFNPADKYDTPLAKDNPDAISRCNVFGDRLHIPPIVAGERS